MRKAITCTSEWHLALKRRSRFLILSRSILNSAPFSGYKKAVKNFQEEETKEGSFIEVPNNLRGNYYVFKLLSRIFILVDKNKERDAEGKYSEMLLDSIDLSHQRQPTGFERFNSEDIMQSEGTMAFVSFNKVRQTLIELSTRSLNAVRKVVEKRSIDTDAEPSPPWSSCDLYGEQFEACNTGDLVFIRCDRLDPVVLTQEHFRRLCESIRSIANSFMLTHLMSVEYDGLYDIFDKVVDCGLEEPDGVGEVIKAARNMIFSRMSESGILSKTNLALYQGTILDKEWKFRWGREMYIAIRTQVRGEIDQLNFSHIWKFVPHPDTDMEECFRTIKGLDTPNDLDPALESTLDGALRKALAIGCLRSNMRIVLRQGNPGLMKLMEGSSLSMSTLISSDPSLWEGCIFEKCPQLEGFKMVTIPVGDKSSATDEQYTPSELGGMRTSWLKRYMSGKDLKTPELPNVNDIQSRITGTDNLHSGRAFKRFNKLVRSWEKWEQFLKLKSPEEMTTEQREEFMESNPDLVYNVNTEPKYGEKHKKVTRLFYVGEQALKILTQTLERLAKRVGSRSVGISITKSHFARKSDLATFARAISDTHNVILYASFDISEFSKKFPPKVIRQFGKALAELTGEDSLRRLDILFKCTKIYHSSRGFFDFQTTQDGFFEGFFNFIWTIIHSTIMETVLRLIHLPGVHLAYSDDGLLRLAIPNGATIDDGAMEGIVMQLQDFYKKFGLSFHLGKTTVSTKLFEYLGDIGLNGHLLDLYTKEMLNLGIVEQSDGFNPVMATIEAYDGQARSAVAAGMDVWVASAMLGFYSMEFLSRRFPLLTSDRMFRKFILLCPRSAGGFRIPSPFELSSSTSVEKYSEVIADCHLVRDQPLASVLTQLLLGSYREKEDFFRALLFSSPFLSPLPDTTGLGLSIGLVDQLNEEYGTKHVSSPLDDKTLKAIYQASLGVENFNPMQIGLLIQTSPEWVAHQESLKLLRSKSALGLLNRKYIVNAQRKDSMNCSKALGGLLSYYHESRGIRTNPSKLVALIRAKVKPLSLCHARLSPRLYFVPTDSQSRFRVSIGPRYDDRKNLESSYYLQPTPTRPGMNLSGAWDNSAFRGGSTSGLNQFFQIVATLIISSPGLEDYYRIVSKHLGVDIPGLPTGNKIQMQRLRKWTKTQDFVANWPSYMDAHTVISVVGALRSLYEGREYPDKTTYQQAFRVLAAMEYLRARRHKKVGPNSIVTYEIGASPSLLADMSPEIPRVKPNYHFTPPRSKYSDEVLSWYSRAVQDEVDARNTWNKLNASQMYANLGHTPYEGSELDDLAEFLSYQLSRELHTHLKGRHTDYYNQSVPLTDITILNKRIVQQAVADAYMMSLKNQASVDSWEDYIESVVTYFERTRGNSLISDQLTDYVRSISYEQGTARRERVALSNIGNAVSIERTVVFTSGGAGTASRELVYNFRSVVWELINKLYTRGKELGWNNENAVSIDNKIDMCVVLQASLRPSEHRSEPFNKFTLRINALKFLYLRDIAARQGGQISKQELLRRSLDRALRNECLDLLQHAVGKHPDHKILIEEPANDFLVDRAIIYGRLGPAGYIYPGSLKQEALNLATAAKDSIYSLASESIVMVPTRVAKVSLESLTEPGVVGGMRARLPRWIGRHSFAVESHTLGLWDPRLSKLVGRTLSLLCEGLGVASVSLQLRPDSKNINSIVASLPGSTTTSNDGIPLLEYGKKLGMLEKRIYVGALGYNTYTDAITDGLKLLSLGPASFFLVKSGRLTDRHILAFSCINENFWRTDESQTGPTPTLREDDFPREHWVTSYESVLDALDFLEGPIRLHHDNVSTPREVIILDGMPDTDLMAERFSHMRRTMTQTRNRYFAAGGNLSNGMTRWNPGVGATQLSILKAHWKFMNAYNHWFKGIIADEVKQESKEEGQEEVYFDLSYFNSQPDGFLGYEGSYEFGPENLDPEMHVEVPPDLGEIDFAGTDPGMDTWGDGYYSYMAREQKAQLRQIVTDVSEPGFVGSDLSMANAWFRSSRLTHFPGDVEAFTALNNEVTTLKMTPRDASYLNSVQFSLVVPGPPRSFKEQSHLFEEAQCCHSFTNFLYRTSEMNYGKAMQLLDDSEEPSAIEY